MNPRIDGNEHCKAITLISGKTIDRPIQDNTKNDENNAGNSGNFDETAEKNAGTTRKAKKLLKNLAIDEHRKTELKAPLREDTPVVLYPQRLKKNKLDNQFSKFMEIPKKA